MIKKNKNMDFTFGIITDCSNTWMDIIIDSIEKENIPNYEILIIGGNEIKRDNVKWIYFDENIKSKWITRKKNIITNNAKYENIVYMHDYIYLLPGWYEGYLKYGDDFKACMNKIINIDNTRYRDWTLCWPERNIVNREYLIPYDMDHLSKMMYFSGAYWVAKKEIMLEIPLDENRCWGGGEDSAWSVQYRKKYKFSMNINSSVKMLKYNDPVFIECSKRTIDFLKTINDDYIKNFYEVYQ